MAANTQASVNVPISRIVGFKYKPGTTIEQKRQAVQGLFKFYDDVGHLISGKLQGGKNEDPNKGYDYMFTTEFKNSAARDAFTISQEHTAYKATIGPIIQEVFVFDYVKGSFGF